jgi:fluoroacetyl-CoA thioesterase
MQPAQPASSKSKLIPGLTGVASGGVTVANTAIALGSGDVPVFATPALAGLMEAAAVDALRDVLDDGQTTVGVQLDLQHLAATPVGMTVRAEARLMTVEGRRLTFRVSAADATEQIGVGTHQRVIVDRERFMHRTLAKHP